MQKTIYAGGEPAELERLDDELAVLLGRKGITTALNESPPGTFSFAAEDDGLDALPRLVHELSARHPNLTLTFHAVNLEAGLVTVTACSGRVFKRTPTDLAELVPHAHTIKAQFIRSP